MQLILLENISRLGRVGEVVKVKPGFGRNFLIPQKKAIRATKDNVKEFEGRRAALEQRDQEMKAAAEKQAAAFSNVVVKIVRQASEDGKLYGSVNVRDIAAGLKESGRDIERRQIDLNTSIKELGVYTATVSFHADVRVPFKIEVVRSLEQSLLVDGEEEPVAEQAPAVEASEEE